MMPFDWSTVNAESFAAGSLWFALCYLIVYVGQFFIAKAFEIMAKLADKYRARKKAKQKENDHVR